MLAGVCCCWPSAARAERGGSDLVARWNVIALEAGRAKPFLVQSRALAMVHAAMFDAVNGIEPKYAPYLVDARAPAGASASAAASGAAHGVLVALHPEQRATLDAALAAALVLASARDRGQGLSFGERVAADVVAARSADGSAAAVSYAPRAGVGYWQATPPAHAAAMAPHWGRVQPFLVRDRGGFSPGPPPPLASDDYARDFDEVARIGGKASALRTPDQTEAAVFWTAFAPQIWSGAARQALAQRPQLGLLDRARVFALVSGAIADALIVGWAIKYEHELWRPVTAIRAAQDDGNDRTRPDPAWEPLVATPPFPCYVSGHAIAAGAAEQVLVAALGQDRVAFSISNPDVGIARSYRSFSQLAREANDARVWGGVHFRASQTAGLRAGRAIGRAIAASRLQPLAAAAPSQLGAAARR